MYAWTDRPKDFVTAGKHTVPFELESRDNPSASRSQSEHFPSFEPTPDMSLRYTKASRSLAH